MSPAASLFRRARRLDRLYLVADLLALLCAYRLGHWLRFSAHVGPMLFGFINGLFGWGVTANLSGTK